MDCGAVIAYAKFLRITLLESEREPLGAVLAICAAARARGRTCLAIILRLVLTSHFAALVAVLIGIYGGS